MYRMIILFLLLPYIVFSQTIYQALEKNYRDGKLSDEDYLIYKALSIYAPEKLPTSYSILRQDIPIKSGTLIAAEIKKNWHNLSSQNQALLKFFVTRPEMPYEKISPSGQFRIHYSTYGANAVSSKDNDLNGVPDYVDSVMIIFDYCHQFETDSLGLKSPPHDYGYGGGNEYDVYIQNFRSMYGQTVPDAEVPTKPNTYYSYLEIDNNYLGFPTSGIDGLRVTAAHEYFHAIQMGYKFKGDDDFWEKEVFYYEISSTWMEDVIYDDVNDYYNYLYSFFNEINMPFDTYDYYYEYGNCLWNHMLAKKFGRQIVVKIWEEIADVPVLNALENVLHDYGTSFTNELQQYAIWNYFTGSRNDSINYYPEGKYYPEANFSCNQNFSADTTVEFVSNQLAYSYLNFYDTEYENTITLIPVNIEQNTNLTRDFLYEIVRAGSPQFEKVAEKLYVRLLADSPSNWKSRAIITDAGGNVYIDTMIEGPELVYGPNPYKPNEDQRLNAFCKLRYESPVTITIFSENGYKIGNLKQSDIDPNHFYWDRTESGDFPGSSGIYLLLLKTKYAEQIYKLAVIR